MANQYGLEDGTTRSLQASEIEEVDVEVGFIIASCCCSLELEEDDDLEDTLGLVEEVSPDEAISQQAAEGIRHRVRATED